jgi:hypothetical protein
MATRISLRQHSNGKFSGWACKHSIKAAQPAECDGHVVLCERCQSAVKNGADLLNYLTRQTIEPAKITVGKLVKRAAAAAAR